MPGKCLLIIRHHKYASPRAQEEAASNYISDCATVERIMFAVRDRGYGAVKKLAAFLRGKKYDKTLLYGVDIMTSDALLCILTLLLLARSSKEIVFTATGHVLTGEQLEELVHHLFNIFAVRANPKLVLEILDYGFNHDEAIQIYNHLSQIPRRTILRYMRLLADDKSNKERLV